MTKVKDFSEVVAGLPEVWRTSTTAQRVLTVVALPPIMLLYWLPKRIWQEVRDAKAR